MQRLNDILKELPPDIARSVARYGVKLAIDLLQTLYSDLNGERDDAQPKRGRGRPKVKSEAALEAAPDTYGWPSDPKARSREMKRRQAVAKKKKARAQKVAAAKKRWDSKTKAEKQAWLHTMQTGKYGKARAA